VWVLALVAVTLLINVPIANTAWVRYRLASEGLETTATVHKAEGVPKDDPGAWFVRYSLPENIDPEGRQFSTEVDKQTFEEAKASEEVTVTYLDGKPRAHVVEGQVTRRFGLFLVGLADVVLLLMFLLYFFFGRKQDAPLALLATADVRRCAPSWTLRPVGKDEYVATGEIVDIAGDVIVLETEGGRRVRLVLGDHTNDLGYQQPAEIRGRVLPDP
jgi:hypothetical protein